MRFYFCYYVIITYQGPTLNFGAKGQFWKSYFKNVIWASPTLQRQLVSSHRFSHLSLLTVFSSESCIFEEAGLVLPIYFQEPSVGYIVQTTGKVFIIVENGFELEGSRVDHPELCLSGVLIFLSRLFWRPTKLRENLWPFPQLPKRISDRRCVPRTVTMFSRSIVCTGYSGPGRT